MRSNTLSELRSEINNVLRKSDTGLPAILITYCATQIDAPSAFPGHLFGVKNRLIFISGAVTIALTPFAVLLSYVFRLTTMSRSTLFIGPFDAR